eukprot:896413-Prymnesium_polylepis.1
MHNNIHDPRSGALPAAARPLSGGWCKSAAAGGGCERGGLVEGDGRRGGRAAVGVGAVGRRGRRGRRRDGGG